jgi:Do/DeqQ family serine protease
MVARTSAGLLVGLLGAAGAFAAGRATAPQDPHGATPPREDGARSDDERNDEKRDQLAQAPAPRPAPSGTPAVPVPSEAQPSVGPLVERVKGAVVAIQSTKVIRRVVREDPFTQYLRERFGGGAPSERPEIQRGLGSGFVIDKTGTVLTNNHVVAGADEVVVILGDDRKFEATVVGSDPATDVAVVKLTKPPADLQAASLGNSDTVSVGDYVLAIGNPLGLGQTVTMGIVSAKNRSLGTTLGDIEAKYQDFIQTDAAINQGNSGGPLYNFRGEVVGINSAILNPAVAMNVGFAIPINLARQIADQIKAVGRVARGFLGVSVVPLDAEVALQMGIEQTSGALVTAVGPGSPAEKAGIRVNDVLLEIGGRKLDRRYALAQAVAALPPGSTTKIKLVRDGKPVETDAVLAETATGDAFPVLGIVGKVLEGDEARRLGLDPGQGVRVIDVDPRGPISGELRSADVILSIERTAATIRTLKAFEQTLQQGGWGRLIIQRGNRRMVITLSG